MCKCSAPAKDNLTCEGKFVCQGDVQSLSRVTIAKPNKTFLI